MSLRPVLLNAVTGRERQSTTDAIRQAIADADDWIEDFALFSNISLMVRCSIASSSTTLFGDRLLALGLHIDGSEIALLKQRQEDGDAEFSCTLNVTFFTTRLICAGQFPRFRAKL